MKQEPKQIKCYCGHTTYCDCEPLEESKQETTLEEAAANLADPNICKTDNWIAGAKWQQQQDKNKYSEEDMIEFAFDTYYYISGIMKVPFNQLSENKLHAIHNFENFKKK